MKERLMSILRNRETGTQDFRNAAHKLATLLVFKCDPLIPKISKTINTPLEQTEGCFLKEPPLLIPILRSGIALLPAFIQFYPHSSVGFVGAKRNEHTTLAELYYQKFPAFGKETPILILDPMVATGGSAILAVKALKNIGALEEQIILVSFIAAEEGLANVNKTHPRVRQIIAQIDKNLDPNKFIVPGLGDFGDRYFGTPG